MRRLPRADALTAVLLFLGLSSLYFATASGITSSNDGSHYALTRAMAEYGRFTLDPFDPFAEGNDIAVRQGRFYSDRPPGTALAAVPFYLAGGYLPAPRTPIPSRHDPDNPRLLYVLLLPVWAGAGAVTLLFLELRRQQVSRAAALMAGLTLGVATIHWKYSTVLFSHALLSILMIGALMLALHLDGRGRAAWWETGLLGLLLGFAVLVQYEAAILAVIITIFVLVTVRPPRWRRRAAALGPLLAGGAVSAAFLAFYNTVNFGSPTTLSYDFAINYPWAGDFAATFSWPLWPGLQAMLFWGEGGGWCNGPCFNQGLFLLSPVLLLALPGSWLYFQRQRRAAVLTGITFLVYLLLLSKHVTAHGFTGDSRYLAPYLGLLVLPLGHAADWLLARPEGAAGRLLGLLLLFGLFFLSLGHMMLHIGFSYNYDLDLARLSPLVASPQNWRYLRQQLFPNAGNLPLLWLAEGAMALLVAVAGLARRRWPVRFAGPLV